MQKIFQTLSVMLFLSLLQYSCSGDSEPAIDEKDTPPTNLQVSFQIVGENTDPEGNGSGIVHFEASATNALDYQYAFNNQEVNAPDGATTITFGATGTYSVTVTALGEGNTSLSREITVSVFVDPDLVWAQEFEQEGAPDPEFWNFELGDGCDQGICGWGNGEQQWYTNEPDNIIVEDDVLKITAKAEARNGYNYTSARITTKNKFAFTYGRVEVRAKLPEGGGTWPAIWMLGSNIDQVGWPKCGEIDIMEHTGNDPGRVSAATHDEFYHAGNARYYWTDVSNVSTEYHIYSLNWDENGMDFFVDGNLFFESPNSSELPYNQDFYLLLNIAMGGNLGGTIDESFSSGSMEIDYIRVYQ
ncbi:family 16 glycosylhydrolase [Robertkochia marina]|nr:family 16 glycosylhydrolase [Robertkochia marina]